MNLHRSSLLVVLLLGLLAMRAPAAEAGGPAIIPWPQKVELQAGAFSLTPETRIRVDAAARETGEFLAARLRQSTGYPCQVGVGATAPGGILLTSKDARADLGEEGYELTVTPDGVTVRAPGQAGLFYGVQTLLQLLPPEVFSNGVVAGGKWTMPCLRIEDRPRFAWRGLMLDVARHFYTKAEVEQLLDVMAQQKMNVFHWHLTDDQGWRIEIQKYPELTRIGAWRNGIGFGLDPKSATAYGPDGRYGGYYTADDIREIVGYAAARHIVIVPEIEMPGHSAAALIAYPQFASAAQPSEVGPSGSAGGVYNPADEKTFAFLQDVLTEVFALFPGKYIHLGGDEVPKDFWQHSPACQALMRREGLANEEALQGWFMQRMEKFVEDHGRIPIGWSEALQGGISGKTVIMDWIGGGVEAARQGHDAVMTPTSACYFDYYQSADTAHEPRAIGGLTPLEKTYAFEPIPAGLTPAQAAHILGAQGNLWTEFVANPRHAEYMIFPRLTALAEVTWSPAATRDYAAFTRRLEAQNRRFDLLGIHYRPLDASK